MGSLNNNEEITLTPEGAVSISYPTLVASPQLLSPAIEKAFGSNPNCLGIVIVRDLPPEYPALRERLLKLAYQFANLDVTVSERYADPASKYRTQEIMNGKPDLCKAYPEYYSKNIWPSNDIQAIKGFEEAFKDLGRFIFQVGCKLASACQPFASSHLLDSSLSLAELIKTSQTTKARLLHYFPPSADSPPPAEDEAVDSWCGFHLDHSLLTGLCSAMFLHPQPNGEPAPVPSPSPVSGLYIRTRGGTLTKVSIPAECLAFQTGEALELATAGSLRATPHCVRVGGVTGMERVSRETFALFMQPDTDQQIAPSENFGQFTKRVLNEHYTQEV
ncbi:Clavaminate synthase-like protein [Amylocystis lapponica]|nr:Clavaminate synthase-like protein [Amylocystis lapponica]